MHSGISSKYILIFLILFSCIHGYGQDGIDTSGGEDSTGDAKSNMIAEYKNYFKDEVLRKKYSLPDSWKSSLTKDERIMFSGNANNLDVLSEIFTSSIEKVLSSNDELYIRQKANASLLLLVSLLNNFAGYSHMIEGHVKKGNIPVLALFADPVAIIAVIDAYNGFKQKNNEKAIFLPASDDDVLLYFTEYLLKNESFSLENKKEFYKFLSLDETYTQKYLLGLYRDTQKITLADSARLKMKEFLLFLLRLNEFTSASGRNLTNNILHVSFSFLTFYIGENYYSELKPVIDVLQRANIGDKNKIPLAMLNEIMTETGYPEVSFSYQYGETRLTFLKNCDNTSAFEEYFTSSLKHVEDPVIKKDILSLSYAFLNASSSLKEEVAFLFVNLANEMIDNEAGDGHSPAFSDFAGEFYTTLERLKRKLSPLNLYRLEILKNLAEYSKTIILFPALKTPFLNFVRTLDEKPLTELLSSAMKEMSGLAGDYFIFLKENDPARLENIISKLKIHKSVILTLIDGNDETINKKFKQMLKENDRRYNSIFEIYTKKEMSRMKESVLFGLEKFPDFFMLNPVSNQLVFVDSQGRGILLGKNEKKYFPDIIKIYDFIMIQIESDQYMQSLILNDGFSRFVFDNIVDYDDRPKIIAADLENIFSHKYEIKPDEHYFLLLFSGLYLSLSDIEKKEYKDAFIAINQLERTKINSLILAMADREKIPLFIDIFEKDTKYYFLDNKLGIQYFYWKNLFYDDITVKNKLSGIIRHMNSSILAKKIAAVKEMNKRIAGVSLKKETYGLLDTYIIFMYEEEDAIPIRTITEDNLETYLDFLAACILLFDSYAIKGDNTLHTFVYRLADALLVYRESHELSKKELTLFSDIGEETYKGLFTSGFYINKFSGSCAEIFMKLAEFL